jgi:hypothetical protein
MTLMRTVIDLPEEQLRALAEMCERDQISRAEAVRRAVSAYLKASGEDALQEAFGMWAGRDVDGVRFQRALRDEWDRECEPSSIPTS